MFIEKEVLRRIPDESMSERRVGQERRVEERRQERLDANVCCHSGCLRLPLVARIWTSFVVFV